jgi:hypothetical protein
LPLGGKVTKRRAHIGSGACVEGELDPRPQLLERESALDEVILQGRRRTLAFTVSYPSHTGMVSRRNADPDASTDGSPEGQHNTAASVVTSWT